MSGRSVFQESRRHPASTGSEAGRATSKFIGIFTMVAAIAVSITRRSSPDSRRVSVGDRFQSTHSPQNVVEKIKYRCIAVAPSRRRVGRPIPTC
jgi:hypothetical protein